MKTMTEPTLSLTLTVPAAWEDIAELSACDKGLPIWDMGSCCSICRKRTHLRRIPTGNGQRMVAGRYELG